MMARKGKLSQSSVAERRHQKEQDQRDSREKAEIGAAHPRRFAFAQGDIGCDHRQKQGNDADLKTHAIIRPKGVIGKTKAPKGTKELAPLHKVLVKVVGIGDVDLLLQRIALRPRGERGRWRSAAGPGDLLPRPSLRAR